jgi:Family of unknown function (DUF5670)
MLLLFLMVLLLWLGLFTFNIGGGLIHLLLLVAFVALVLHVATVYRRAV